MSFHLILTLDYELFGDGSGCLEHCVIQPTERLRRLSEAFDAPLTLFVEALEFDAMRNLPRDRRVAGYDGVERQLAELHADGHSLELHAHPQWMSAERQGGDWRLAFDKWRIGDLEEEELRRCLDSGFAYLDRIGVSPRVFRAGGWTIQPALRSLELLASYGINVDSTVAPGMFNPASGDWYDFRSTPEAPTWTCRDDVCVSDASGKLLEVPIATSNLGFFTHLSALREAKSGSEFPAGCQGSYRGPNDRWQTVRSKLAKLLRAGTVMLDFSTMPAWALVRATEEYMSRFAGCEEPVPVVAIGHNKNFTTRSAENLAAFLDWCRGRPEFEFSSYAPWLPDD